MPIFVHNDSTGEEYVDEIDAKYIKFTSFFNPFENFKIAFCCELALELLDENGTVFT